MIKKSNILSTLNIYVSFSLFISSTYKKVLEKVKLRVIYCILQIQQTFY